MHDAATVIPFFIENDEPFQCLIDEPYFTVVRDEGVYVAQVHLPADLGELSFLLGTLGFVGMGAHAEDGILEIMMRKLGDVDLDEGTAGEVEKTMNEREEVYA